jgi:hypothetical protein
MNKPPLPANRVSRNIKQGSKCDGRTGVLIVSTEGAVIRINCGWSKVHARKKFREDSAEYHIYKRHHGGNAIWL